MSSKTPNVMLWGGIILAVIAIIAVVIVVWQMNKTPADPSNPSGTSCTAGATCAVSSPDPNGNYTFDATCNCVISSCTGSYTLTNGACVVSGPQDTPISGLDSNEDSDYGGPVTVDTLDKCKQLCYGHGCSVYDYDGATCKMFADYLGVSGGHELQNPGGKGITYVVPFSKSVSTGMMSWTDNGTIVGKKASGTCSKGNYLTCRDDCLKDDSCQGISCFHDDCMIYNDKTLDYVNNVAGAPEYNRVFLKFRPTAS